MNMYRNIIVRPAVSGRPAAVLVAACVAFAALPEPAAAIQILDAANHAELEAAVSATGVSRVALANDRIRRVIRSPGGFRVEHDATSGDLYLRPPEGPGSEVDAGAALPITLFLGTERGFTYRLTLTADARASAQVLIRNAAAARPVMQAEGSPERDARVAELVRLVRAVARRESLPGFVAETDLSGRQAIEVWRGVRFVAHVLAAGPHADAPVLAERFGNGVVAVWVADAGGTETGERIAVVVTEPGRAGAVR